MSKTGKPEKPTYTFDRPTKAGYYWYRYVGDREGSICEVFGRGKQLTVSPCHIDLQSTVIEWCGPLKQPADSS